MPKGETVFGDMVYSEMERAAEFKTNVKEANRFANGYLDLGAYRKANNEDALGMANGIWYARPKGTDSSGAMATINPPMYWSLVGHRDPKYLAKLIGDKKTADKLMKTNADIVNTMNKYIWYDNKPKIDHDMEQTGGLKFWNFTSMQDKYRGGVWLDKPKEYNMSNIDRKGHLSSKAERKFMASLYHRSDMRAVFAKDQSQFPENPNKLSASWKATVSGSAVNKNE